MHAHAGALPVDRFSDGSVIKQPLRGSEDSDAPRSPKLWNPPELKTTQQKPNSKPHHAVKKDHRSYTFSSFRLYPKTLLQEDANPMGGHPCSTRIWVGRTGVISWSLSASDCSLMQDAALHLMSQTPASRANTFRYTHSYYCTENHFY